MPINSKSTFLFSYNASQSYANTFTFIKCQSVQNELSPIIQCHQVLCQYLYVYQVPITSKSILQPYWVLRQYLHVYQVPINLKCIFSHYTTPPGLMPIPLCLSSANHFKINFTMPSGLTPIHSRLSSANQFIKYFLPLYNATGSYANIFTCINCQLVPISSNFSPIIIFHKF